MGWEAGPWPPPRHAPETMFLGEYLHTFDSKNRISLPAKFRKGLGRAVILTRGLDRCIYIYPREAWEREAARYAREASGNAARRGLARLFLAGSFETAADSAGRVLVPDHLRAYALLKGKAVVAGVAERVEIWDASAWKRYTRAIERDAERFAETVALPARSGD